MNSTLPYLLIGFLMLSSFFGKADRLDTLPYSLFEEGDSLYININHHQQKYFIHKVGFDQTAFSIATFYGLRLSELRLMNPERKLETISIGDPIRIIVSSNQIIRYKRKGFVEKDHHPVIYKVKSGETLYSIARSYFREDQNLLMEHNGLNEHSIIRPGQELVVGWIHKLGIHRLDGDRKPAVFKENPALEQIANANKRNRQAFLNQIYKRRTYSHSGPATRSVKYSSKLFVLHRFAKVGSIVEIRNPNTEITLYAKVVAAIPATGYDEDIILAIPENLAEALGGKDRRFYVKVRYIK